MGLTAPSGNICTSPAVISPVPLPSRHPRLCVCSGSACSGHFTQLASYHMGLRVWLLSLSIMFPRFVHAVAGVSAPLLFPTE